MNFFDSAEGKWFRKLLETSMVERPGKPISINATAVAQMCSADPKSAQVAMQLLAQQLNEKLKGQPVSDAEDVAGDQRLVLGTLFLAYCAVRHVEGNVSLGAIPKELQFIIDQYPIIMECMQFVTDHNERNSDKSLKDQNTNIQPTFSANEPSVKGKGRLCQFCKERPGKIEHRISPPMKVVEICVCDECSRSIIY